jgi:hypothetical protein
MRRRRRPASSGPAPCANISAAHVAAAYGRRRRSGMTWKIGGTGPKPAAAMATCSGVIAGVIRRPSRCQVNANCEAATQLVPVLPRYFATGSASN